MKSYSLSTNMLYEAISLPSLYSLELLPHLHTCFQSYIVTCYDPSLLLFPARMLLFPDFFGSQFLHEAHDHMHTRQFHYFPHSMLPFGTTLQPVQDSFLHHLPVSSRYAYFTCALQLPCSAALCKYHIAFFLSFSVPRPCSYIP